MPVVSQSIIRPMVPVGASTEAWELRTPKSSAISQAASHDCWAALSSSWGSSSSSMLAASWRCMSSTRNMCSALSA